MRGRGRREHLDESVVEFDQIIAVQSEVLFFAPISLSWKQVGDVPGRFKLIAFSSAMVKDLAHRICSACLVRGSCVTIPALRADLPASGPECSSAIPRS